MKRRWGANGRSIRESAPLLQGEHVRMQCEEVETREQKGIGVRDALCEQVMETWGSESRPRLVGRIINFFLYISQQILI